MKIFIRSACLVFLACISLHAEDDRPIEDDHGKREKADDAGLPTLWLAGDSTVKSSGESRGWGQEIGQFFDDKKINVVNRAIGGRSSLTFTTEGRWKEIADSIKKGDYVMIQFGHNDVGSPGESSRYRGTLKGLGDEVREVTMPDGSKAEVHTYGYYIRAMAKEAREKGARVILCSPVPHKNFDDRGDFVPDWANYAEWVQTIAKEEHAAYVDLATIVGEAYDKAGQRKVEKLFADARTHSNAKGAEFVAECVVGALRGIPTAPLDEYLSTKGKKIRKERTKK